jgi:hypothetical protein
MKMKIKMLTMKNAAGLLAENNDNRNANRPQPEGPVVKTKPPIWKGLRIHSGSWQSFRELLRLRATAPFKFTLPGLRAGKAAWQP